MQNAVIRNRTIADDKVAQHAFATLLRGFDARRLLDVGANIGNFATEIRDLGFEGMIYSVEPQAGCRRKMTRSSREDLRWIVLPSQGAGAEDGVMTLNVTENGYSSSFLLPHANHLRAEPTVRVVSGETVFVSRTCGLLPPAEIARIDALKVDTQGYELNVLQGLAGQFAALKLIMVELSAVPTYAEGPSLSDVAHYLSESLGFVQVSLTPAFVDEAAGEIQQYDGIYVRRDLQAEAMAMLADTPAGGSRPPRSAAGNTRGGVAAVVLSLPGRPPKRPDSRGRDFGPSWLESCHKSWMSHAPSVISISEAAPNLPGVTWRNVAHKPSLKQIVASLAEDPPPDEGFILLTNADIILGPHLKTLLARMDAQVLYYCSRLDVRVAEDNPRNLELVDEYSWGYDAFFVPREAIAAIHQQELLPDGLMIGEPFWDYALPLAALVAGRPIKKFFSRPHPIVHLKHDPISNDHLTKTGRIFLGWLRDLQQRPPSPVSGMIAEFVAAFDEETGDETEKREAMCRSIISGLT